MINAEDISKFVNTLSYLNKEQKDKLYNDLINKFVDGFKGGAK